MKENVIIHIGLGKTGTSFLQREIYPKLKNCKTYGLFNERFNWETKLSKDKINIISNEQISGRPNTSKKSADRYEIARRFKSMFPDAKIILVLREKKSWVESIYREYIKSGFGAYDYDQWYREIFDEEFLDFEKYEKYLKKLFDKVLVLWFEDLKKNPDNFVKQICDFIGVEIPKYENKTINIRLDDKALERWRKMNRFFKSPYSLHKGFLPMKFNPLLYYHKIMVKIRKH